MDPYQADDVHQFWFTELTPDDWFAGGAQLDARVAERFTSVHAAVAAAECAGWRATPAGALAEVLVLDQFSRHLFRGTAQAFATDGQALTLAQIAISREYDKQVSELERPFFYLPYMHSESPRIQETSLQLFTEFGSPKHLEQAQIHKDIIDQFGRYPHRNAALGRSTTSEEAAFLDRTDHGFYDA